MLQSSLFVLAASLFFSASTLAQNPPDFTVQLPENANEATMIFKPSPNHHFNLKAPSQVKKNHKKETETLELKLETMSGSVGLGSLKEDCQITGELYICDDANTYCVPKTKTFRCQDLSEQKLLPLDSTTTKDASLPTQKSTDHELFIVNEPELAFEQSQKTQKPMLIDFFGTWCPPCNILDETVFNTKEFKKLKSEFIYLKVDADQSVSWSLKSKYNVKGYPTVVFANPQGEEISRVVGSRSAPAFIKEMKSALKFKKFTLEEREKQAESMKSPELTWAFGEMSWRQEDTAKALKYFSLAAKKKDLNEKEKDLLQYLPLLLMSKSTDKNIQNQSIELLKVSLRNYPAQETFYDKLSTLTQLAEKTENEKLKTWVNEQTLTLADLWLKNPHWAADSEMTSADLLSMKAQAFEDLKKENEAKEAYAKTAEAYTQLIKKQKLSLESSRGYNIERIYAIAKSGDFARADQLYLQMEQLYPSEFTFFYNHAQALKEMKKDDQALEKAEQAYKYSYGDNKLRAVYLIAELQGQKGDKKKSLSFLEEVIKTTSLPQDESVRTHRYLARLKKLRTSLSEQK